MAKRKMKASVKYSILAVVLIACIAVIFAVFNNSKNKDDDQEYHGQIIQDEGNVEIIIPEELGTDGF